MRLRRDSLLKTDLVRNLSERGKITLVERTIPLQTENMVNILYAEFRVNLEFSFSNARRISIMYDVCGFRAYKKHVFQIVAASVSH